MMNRNIMSTRILAMLAMAAFLSGPARAEDPPLELFAYGVGASLVKMVEACAVRTTAAQRSALPSKVAALRAQLSPAFAEYADNHPVPSDCPSDDPKDQEQFTQILAALLEKAPQDFKAFMEAGPPPSSASPTASSAPQAPSGGLVKGIGVEAFAAALRDKGFKAEVVPNPGQNPFIRTGMNGRSASVSFTDCKAGECGSYIFRTYISGGSKFTLQLANDWNRQKRFSKAYLDKDNDPTLEWEIDLSAGVGTDFVKATIDSFDRMAGDFEKALP